VLQPQYHHMCEWIDQLSCIGEDGEGTMTMLEMIHHYEATAGDAVKMTDHVSKDNVS
jgi:hypothetical protein